MLNLDPDGQLCALDADMRCLRRFDLHSREMGQVLSLMPGDLLFSADSNWLTPGYMDFVGEARQKGLRYSQLFYDLIGWRYPYAFPPGQTERAVKSFAEGMEHADICIAISRNTAEDMKAFVVEHAMKPRLIHVVRLGDEPLVASRGEVRDVVKRYVDTRFLLCVGSVQYRKNQITLVNAWRMLYSRGWRSLPVLLFVGQAGWMSYPLSYQLARDRELAGTIRLMGDVSDAELDFLYRHCQFTLYPSLYEGWGLPVAESLQYGKPCICAGNSSMAEIAPDLTQLLDPLDTAAWADAVAYWIENPGEVERVSQRISREYKATSWEATAREILIALGRHG